MPLFVVKHFGDLDDQLTLAPERYAVEEIDSDAPAVGDIATMRSSYARPKDAGPFVPLDTTHALDGFIASRALQTADTLQSSKKQIQPGDVIVSRLRPYLRQIAYVDQALADLFPDAQLCCSTEFYVLRSKNQQSLAFLVPFLLNGENQLLLARSQEGGHHPRVPAATLSSMRMPATLLERCDEISQRFIEVVNAYRAAERARNALTEDVRALFL